MTKTYSQLQKQIDALQREADKVKQKEVDGVIARIREAITTYGLTSADLGLSGGVARKSKAAAKTAAVKSKQPRAPKTAAAPKFRDSTGNSWGGRGPRPKWLRDALAAGRELSEFQA